MNEKLPAYDFIIVGKSKGDTFFPKPVGVASKSKIIQKSQTKPLNKINLPHFSI
jgi:hypothetical protein